jgi:flagellar hook-basal body complex protein FliE
MSGVEAIATYASSGINPLITRLGLPTPEAAHQAASVGFGDILASGMRHVDGKLATANDLVRQFALDDSVPLHQVTFALEEARLSVELAMQVRSRLVESYRELMNMQL